MPEDITIRVPPDAGRGWWLREALAVPELAGEPCPPLERDVSADVMILGGGYTGMWTAWFVKELDPGAEVVILEQDICGGGPSGRNGGFVNSFWHQLPTLCRRFGDADAYRLCRAGQASVEAIGTWCREHDVDAWFAQDGELEVRTWERDADGWDEMLETARRLGILERFHVLDAQEARARIDAPVVRGALETSFGATVHPARLARGLRRELLARGVRIFEHTPVVRFHAGRPPVARTPHGAVRAGAAVVALNAWAQHWRRFRRELTVRGTYIVLTAPASDRLAELGWTDGTGLWDTRASVHYVRTTPDGRIAFGIGGMQPDFARTIDRRYAYDEPSIRGAIADLHRMFPTFADVPIEAAWGGPVDVSARHVPAFTTLEPGTVHAGHGYTGNGVGPSHLGGQVLAHRALDREGEVLHLPLVDLEPKRFPPEPLRSVGAFVANRAIKRRDDALDAGRRVNPFVEVVSRAPRWLDYDLGP
ncbi:MAG TPA: FAD-binding oxidoreductase [Actinomycetota bacterium]|nr:FAD-binding oxidoreductase [Actinomycetota bacterium]